MGQKTGLKIEDIKVQFSYKSVLKGISMDFEEGKIYSLLGENGAGKSTLARVLCGDLKPASGTIYFWNRKVQFADPADAIRQGIFCVHQRPLLSESVSVLDNLRIGNFKFQKTEAQNLIKKWLPGVNEKEPVKNLSVEQHFYVSLCGILLKNPAVLIIDEPPEHFDIQSLKKDNRSIILITHNIEEAVEKSDQIILLKDGFIVSDLEFERLCKQKASESEKIENQKAEIIFRIEKILFSKENSDGDFREIKLPDGVKVEKYQSVKSFMEAEDAVTFGRKKGIGIVPSDKVFRGSNPDLSVFQLLTAKKNGKQKELETYAWEICRKAGVQIKIWEKAGNLSGGMLQRLILEREIAENKKQLVLCQPFKGLDYAASTALCGRLAEVIKDGCQVKLLECIEEHN